MAKWNVWNNTGQHWVSQTDFASEDEARVYMKRVCSPDKTVDEYIVREKIIHKLTVDPVVIQGPKTDGI